MIESASGEGQAQEDGAAFFPIAPATFRAMRYMNDGRYFPENGASDGGNLQKEMKNNVESYRTETSSIETFLGLISYQL